MTKPLTFPAADNGLCFLTLSVNLSNKTEVWDCSETGDFAQSANKSTGTCGPQSD